MTVVGGVDEKITPRNFLLTRKKKKETPNIFFKNSIEIIINIIFEWKKTTYKK